MCHNDMEVDISRWKKNIESRNNKTIECKAEKYCGCKGRKEENVLFNNALNTFYFGCKGVQHEMTIILSISVNNKCTFVH